MRVKKLIELLKQLDPNSEILLYNGFTEDWHEISLEADELCRLKPSVRKQFIVMQEFEQRGLPFPSKQALEEESKKVKVGASSWEFNSYANDPEIYDFKTVNLICGKARGKKSYDRLGSICY